MVTAAFMFARETAAVGFDCSKAATRAEVLICSSTELSALDDEATRFYQLALKHPRKSELLVQLRNWLKVRNACSTFECLGSSYKSFLPEFSANFATVSLPSASKLTRVFDPEMLGANIEYLEQIVGVARNSYGNVRIYKVDSCEVNVQINNGKIENLKLYPSSICTFDLNLFLSNYGQLPRPEELTFGDFTDLVGSGRMYASCLSMCGNASEPVVSLSWQGGRLDGVLEVLIETQLVTDKVISAADEWQAAMERHNGKQWVDERRFNCEEPQNDLAIKAMAIAPVWAITVGYRIPVERCDPTN